MALPVLYVIMPSELHDFASAAFMELLEAFGAEPRPFRVSLLGEPPLLCCSSKAAYEKHFRSPPGTHERSRLRIASAEVEAFQPLCMRLSILDALFSECLRLRAGCQALACILAHADAFACTATAFAMINPLEGALVLALTGQTRYRSMSSLLLLRAAVQEGARAGDRRASPKLRWSI